MGVRHVHRYCCGLAILLFVAWTPVGVVGKKAPVHSPPMGWNTWCTESEHHKGKCGEDFCNENEIKEMALAMASNGMKEAGYQFINLDDCWAGPRVNGKLTADKSRFPSGSLRPIADFVHSLGLKFGLYTCMGNFTCVGRRPGSRGHHAEDAQTFAEWHADFVKADWCFTDGLVPEVEYSSMHSALDAAYADSEYYFNTCEWGLDNPWTWARQLSTTSRIHGDHHDQWAGSSGTAAIIEALAGKSAYAGPGWWPDPDFLMTGLGGQSDAEYRTEFSLWAIAGAQLIVAVDVRRLTTSPLKRDVLLNREIIEVNQDPLHAGDRAASYQNGVQLWTKLLSDGDVAFVLYNPTNASLGATVTAEDLSWNPGRSFTARDLWAHTDLGSFAGSFRVSDILSHGSFFGRAKQILHQK